ncbi:MAG: hypothetical protein VX963_00040 [Actinomycetota bacterium]|nr:hypothetical protein [Actinomycetota bacterium]MEC9057905.1 hypothetical protein [Actinomycetota bacterium]MED5362540.1 hypothetical protein [Actinomycetota bacterium]
MHITDSSWCVVGGDASAGSVAVWSELCWDVVEAQHVTSVVVMSTTTDLLIGESRARRPMVNVVGCDTGLSWGLACRVIELIAST